MRPTKVVIDFEAEDRLSLRSNVWQHPDLANVVMSYMTLSVGGHDVIEFGGHLPTVARALRMLADEAEVMLGEAAMIEAGRPVPSAGQREPAPEADTHPADGVNGPSSAEGSPAGPARVPDLMAALEDSLAAAKGTRPRIEAEA